VGAEQSYRDQQKAERGGPGGDPVGARANPLRHGKPWTPVRVARRRRRPLDEHQAMAGANFAHATAHRGASTPAGSDRRAPLNIPTALDPLAHILDFGPPSTGLGSSWHRRRC
jgi:hypothetical protein